MGQHKSALEKSGVAPFVPYVLRHTALTRFGEVAGNNSFAVAQIAGGRHKIGHNQETTQVAAGKEVTAQGGVDDCFQRR